VAARAIAIWGILGVLALLARALLRLTPIAIESIEQGMTGVEWSIWGSWVVFNAWAEGYRGFQKRFSPRVVARAFHLGANPRLLHVLFAPAFCMSLFHARRRSLVVSWTMLAAIVVLVIFVRRIPQPWRGIIDAGVVVGLAWGTVATVVLFLRGLAGRAVAPPSDLP